MKLRLVKAGQGLVWVRQGLMALKQQPLGFIGLVGLMFMSALLLLSVAGQLGALLTLGLMPVAWTGFMQATRRVITGQRITLGVMAEAFQAGQDTRRNFLVLGLAYVVAMLGVMAIAGLLGPNADEIEQITSKTDDMAEVMANPLVMQDVLTRMALTLPVSMVFWHAPALMLWGKVPAAKALFFSAVASWRNLGAFAVYGLGWAGLMVALGVIDRVLVAIIPVPALVEGLVMVTGMAVAAGFYASLYFTVIDCFEPPSAPSSSPEAEDTPGPSGPTDA